VKTTNSGLPAKNPETASVPSDEKLSDGQYRDHWILSDEERARGFVRPVRLSYVHVGMPEPKNPLRDLTAEEAERYAQFGYVKYEKYPSGEGATGRFWTKAELEKIGKGCKGITNMPRKIAETYAAKPDFYGSTFCCHCGDYFRVGETGEFVWQGTDERVGT
jgi:hypothetical protein